LGGRSELRSVRADDERKVYQMGLDISSAAFAGGGESPISALDFASGLIRLAEDKPTRCRLAEQVKKEKFHTDANDIVCSEERRAVGALADVVQDNSKWGDQYYRNLLRTLAAREGLGSQRLKLAADCYCCTLEALGRSAEAQSIRNRLIRSRSHDQPDVHRH
jgi:hypothetical protein